MQIQHFTEIEGVYHGDGGAKGKGTTYSYISWSILNDFAYNLHNKACFCEMIKEEEATLCLIKTTHYLKYLDQFLMILLAAMQPSQQGSFL